MRDDSVLEVDGFRTLTLWIIRFQLTENLPTFGSAQAKHIFPNPDYSIDPFLGFSQERSAVFLANPRLALAAVELWNEHATSFEYFVQFFDDTERKKTIALSNHTKLVALISDALLHIDPTPILNRFRSALKFEAVHSNYRSDLEREKSMPNTRNA